MGTVRDTFEPDHQIGLVQEGHHILPWMNWPKGDPEDERFKEHYERVLEYLAQLDLPISIRGTQWTSPDWHYWQGGSPSYYTHNWNENRDHWVFSTQIQSMNWIFMLDEAWRVNPNFWFEISTWDGNQVNSWIEGVGAQTSEQLVERSSAGSSPERRKQIDEKILKKSKTLRYLVEGQTYPPERAAGWVQFGMWLLRPRVVREFRGHATPLEAVKPYWMETVKAVDRVWTNATLTEFWRHGRLVPNTVHRHPYQTDLPAKYNDVPRWYLLDTNLAPPRPWEQMTDIPVFSLALMRGEKGKRQWLLYAHSPLANREDVEITIPDFGRVTVDVPRAGEFYVVDERDGKVRQVDSPSRGRGTPCS